MSSFAVSDRHPAEAPQQSSLCVSYPRHGKGVQNVSETRRRLWWVEFGLAVAAQAVHLSTMSGWPMQLHMLQCMDVLNVHA